VLLGGGPALPKQAAHFLGGFFVAQGHKIAAGQRFQRGFQLLGAGGICLGDHAVAVNDQEGPAHGVHDGALPPCHGQGRVTVALNEVPGGLKHMEVVDFVDQPKQAGVRESRHIAAAEGHDHIPGAPAHFEQVKKRAAGGGKGVRQIRRPLLHPERLAPQHADHLAQPGKNQWTHGIAVLERYRCHD